MKDFKTILITCGDPAGIGPEVALRAVRKFRPPKRVEVVLVGPANVWKNRAKALGIKLDALPRVSILETPAHGKVKLGKPSKNSAKDAITSLETACELIKSGKAHALVTMPVSKSNIRSAGIEFTGHTEFLAEKFKSRVTMMLASGQMRFFLVTTHLALKEVPAAITKNKVLDTIRAAAKYTNDLTGKPPRIGLAALNPHGSDSGAFGDEEDKILAPAVESARKEGIKIDGPIPADTLALLMKKGEFDSAAALYHDQALIALKMLEPAGGVNVTFGLPFPRTSPLHGTAFDIAGRFSADPSSALESLKTALNLLGMRNKLS